MTAEQDQILETKKPTGFLKKSASLELERLRNELALQRGILADQRRASNWSSDRTWQVKKFHAIKETKLRIKNAQRLLADFIEEHRLFLGNISDKGRLCWDHFLGGLPIDNHYCKLPEGHCGTHCDSSGRWNRKSKHQSKIPKSIPAIILSERAENAAQFGIAWGNRTGPSIVCFRDTHSYEHPVRRIFSCLGCAHLRIDEEYNTPKCAHPLMLKRHKVPQCVADHGVKRLISPQLCPAIDSQTLLTQPYPCPRHGRSPERIVNQSTAFNPFPN